GQASIKADAITGGNGGKVAVWSNGTTQFAGSISARGGAIAGNGGQVETSGHNLGVADGATVNTLAPYGANGYWLLDPQFIDINTSGSFPATGETYANNATGPATISPASIDTALGSGNVTLQANTDITVTSPLILGNTTANTLELDAGRSILINANVSFLTGTVIFNANDITHAIPSDRNPGTASISAPSSVSLRAAHLDLIMNADGTGGESIGASSLPITVLGSSPTYVKSLGADAFLTTGGGSTSFSLGDAINGSTAVDLGTTGSLTLTAAGATQSGAIFAKNLTITLPAGIATGNPVNLSNNANTLVGNLNITTMGGSAYDAAPYIQFVNSRFLSVQAITALPNSSSLDRGNLLLGTTFGNIALTGNIDVGRITIHAADAISQTGGTIHSHAAGDNLAAGMLTLQTDSTVDGFLTLANTGNLVDQITASTGNGSQTIVAAPGSVSITSARDAAVALASNTRVLTSSTTGGLNLTVAGSYTLLNSSGGSVNNNNAIQISGPLSAGGQIVLQAAGDISQTNGGAVTTTSLTATAGSTGSIFLASSNNAIGTASLFAGQIVSLFDTGNLTLAAIRGATGSTSIPTGAVTVQATGNITLASSAGGSGAIAVLHAGGSIFGGSGTGIQAPSLSLIADSGTIGTTAAPLGIATNLLAARTSNNAGINLSAVPVSGTSLTLTTITSGANGNIVATNNTGLNAVSGNISITGNGAMSFSGNSITAGNLRLAGFTTINASGVSVGSLSAGATGAITISTLGGVQINNPTGGVGIQTPGAVTLNTQGSLTSVNGAAGSIAAGGLTASVNNGAGFGIFLGNGLNAVTGSVTLNAPGQITFFNSVNTSISRANFNGASQGTGAAQSVDIEAFGSGNPTLTIGAGVNQNGTSIAGVNVVLRGAGGIFQSGTGTVSGPTISMVSDAGAIGAATNPVRVEADGFFGATTVNKDINVAFKLPQGATSSSIELGLPTGSAGFNAGTGNINISAPSVFVSGFATTITAASLNILSSAGVELDDVEVGSLSAAASSGGSININSVNGFQLNNPNGGPAIQTTGDASLSVSSGSITQAAGASGAIIAGTFSSFAVGGNNFNNPANAISSFIEIGSLADTTLVNSLSTHLVVALVAGTLTVQSAGDLELVAGPTIANLSAASASTGTDFKGTGSGTSIATSSGTSSGTSTGTSTTSSGNGGISVNNTTVVSAAILSQLSGNIVSLRSGGDGIVLAASGKFINNAGATALLLPGGARFLIYSADPATDTFGGLKTINAGIFGTSYPTAITATGNRYVFTVASSTNTDFMGGATLLTDTATAPVLVGFVSALQPPPRSPPPPPPPTLADLLTVAPLPPFVPPPPPPRPNSPLADLSGPDGQSSEPPSSSDQATEYVANSLEGGPPPPGAGSAGGILIPRFLRAQSTPPQTLADTSLLPGFGNTSLWQ
ncbi:MAG TPA: hypothetical protein VNY75_08355, partial [Rhizomicrobium sp.]|nr:hypothetical protein [Rhizomicrobium sp.]